MLKIEKFSELDTSEFPDFYNYDKPLEMGLWVLWISKEKLGIRKLNAEEIAAVIRNVKEISVDAKSITNAFNRAGDKVYIHHGKNNVYFEIMKPGKDYLLSQSKEGVVKLFYFEPDKRFSSKRILSKDILNLLKGELKIVDPYCDERTLDILKDVKDRKIKFLTRVDNLKENKKRQFLRELQDFKLENKNVEFRNYPYSDIHDRYIISNTHLAILGYSIKDIGHKESFAVVLSKNTSRNVVEALTENFNRRWKQSKNI